MTWERRITGRCLSRECREIASEEFSRRWCPEHGRVLSRIRDEFNGTAKPLGQKPPAPPPAPPPAKEPTTVKLPVPVRAAALARHVHEAGRTTRERAAEVLGMSPSGSLSRVARHAQAQGWIVMRRGLEAGWYPGPVEPPT